MHFQFNMAASSPSLPDATPAPAPLLGGEAVELLRQLLEVQREQLQLARQAAAIADQNARWRAFLARWQDDFPELPTACRAVVPQLERAYVSLINDLADRIRQGESDLDNEFSLNEFLDRYGLRLGQLGSVLSLLAVLAEAAPAPPSM